MKEIYHLIRVQFLNSLGINALIHTKDKKEKRKGILIAIAILYALAVLWPSTVFYFYTMMKVYMALGAPQAILAVAMAMCAILCLLTTVYRGSPTLFGFNDYDIIMPLPVKTVNIVISKLLVLYFTNIGFTLFVMIPAAGVYVYFVSPGVPFYISVTLLTLLIPALPIIVGTALSVGIHMVSTRFRAKNLINILLSLVIMGGILALSFSSFNMTDQIFTDISVFLMNTINRVYPPAALFVAAVKENPLAFLAFVLLSLVPFVLFSVVVTRLFRRLRTVLTTTAASAKFTHAKAKQTAARSVLSTLYRKEARRYFSSPIYVVNTLVGVVMLFLLSGVVIFGNNAMLEQIFEIPQISEKLGTMLPLLVAAFIGTVNPACVSLSMEGKSFSFLKSLPVSAMTVFRAKILFNLTLTIPAVLINVPLMVYALRFDLYTSLLTLAFPLLFSILTPLFGIYINLLFPNFKWTNEVSVVKQSLSALLGMLIPMMSGLFGAIGIAFLEVAAAKLVLLGTCALLALLIAVLDVYLRRRGEAIYLRLI